MQCSIDVTFFLTPFSLNHVKVQASTTSVLWMKTLNVCISFLLMLFCLWPFHSSSFPIELKVTCYAPPIIVFATFLSTDVSHKLLFWLQTHEVWTLTIVRYISFFTHLQFHLNQPYPNKPPMHSNLPSLTFLLLLLSL